MSRIKSRLVRVGKVVHHCRIIIFSKSHVHGYGRLGNGREIIEKNNLIVKLDNQGVLKDASSGTKGVILVDRFS